ncbi:hypothetical protein [Evansella cellulosilytica]|uniref:DUF3221 domain-containing protein n=1 Tax=Evansella cellulosilytica (strain ATCC 21833 / DSM 2522 / FERM P-1141 / JCM 9156 / N-4) TaxID=649639 RepID=E6TRS9_EVAC2|nr:hypothetical protein [Evansella cellulosilytica]ADU29452.1 hypothetical protein Bcell_1187 [Evansella cellulosilytica DSM 2522]
MKKAIIFLLICFFVILLTACSTSETNKEADKGFESTIIVEQNGLLVLNKPGDGYETVAVFEEIIDNHTFTALNENGEVVYYLYHSNFTESIEELNNGDEVFISYQGDLESEDKLVMFISKFY